MVWWLYNSSMAMCSYLDKVLHSLLVMNSFTPLHLLQLSPFSSHQILFPYPTSLYQHSHVLKIVAYPLYSWIVPHAQNILFSLLWSCYSPPSDASVETAGLVTVSAAWLWVNLWEDCRGSPSHLRWWEAMCCVWRDACDITELHRNTGVMPIASLISPI